jgi:hypothetical protein
VSGPLLDALLDTFRYDPHEARDPHTGRWIDVPTVHIPGDGLPPVTAKVGGDRDAVPVGHDADLIEHLSDAQMATFRRPTPTPRKSLLGKVKNQDELAAHAQQAAAMRHYSGDGYRAMNGHLRDGTPLAAEDQAALTGLRAAMVPTPQAVNVDRVVTARAFGADTWEQLLATAGSEVRDPGLTSTSMVQMEQETADLLAIHNEVHAEDLVRVRIKVPAGTRGVFLNGDSEHRNERELVLQDGTRYRIDRVYRISHNPYVFMDMTVVGQ